MRRLIVGGAAAALIAGSGGLALAATGPGPNGNNNHGLCTAYFAGSDNGQAHKHQAGPFQALEQAADQSSSGNQDGTGTMQEVTDYCAQYLGGNGNGNGNNGNPSAGRQPTS